MWGTGGLAFTHKGNRKTKLLLNTTDKRLTTLIDCRQSKHSTNCRYKERVRYHYSYG